MKYIEKERISRSEGNVMAAMLLSTISDYFADPKHQQEFEEWKRRQERPQQAAKVSKNAAGY